MKLANYASFDANFPDDSMWSGEGIIDVPAGRNVIEAICAAIVGGGLQASKPEIRESFGWTVTISHNNHKYLILLQNPGRWLLICEPAPHLLGIFSDGAENFEKFLQFLSVTLRNVPSIKDVIWTTRRQYEM